jgi:hypothetical protein
LNFLILSGTPRSEDWEIAHNPRASAPGHQKEAVMDFAWFFAGILGVAIALRYIKCTSPNAPHHH